MEDMARSRVFRFGEMPLRKMANGGESRDIMHGQLVTGEEVALHESMQVAGAAPNPEDGKFLNDNIGAFLGR